MYRTNRCPCCGHDLSVVCPAVLSPFIAERIGHPAGRDSSLMTCAACEHRCFEPRYEDRELTLIYQGYREEAYFRSRRWWEPWYTRSVNAGLSEDGEELRTRKANARQLVCRVMGDRVPARILDYGGDMGQFIPEGWGPDRTVFEVSGRRPVPGVRQVDHREALVPHGYDLIMICHVLEHLSEPQVMVEEVLPFLAPGGALYLEVPLERPDVSRAGAWPWRGRGMDWLARHPWVFRCVDLHSTWFRIKHSRVPALGILKQHEHIQFFTSASLTALLGRSGLRVLAIEEMGIQNGLRAAKVIGCVAGLPA